MNEKKVSMIIPIYNVENCLDYCMQSVFAQDYRNLEIILVDDGSTDASGKMCEEYANSDERVRVIHKQNGGLSSARNAGMKIMTGDYITFVDSDDYIRADYVSRMVTYLEEDKTDLVVCSFKKITREEDFHLIPKKTTNHYTYDCETTKYKMISRQVPMYAPGKLYKAEYAEYLEFPEGRLFEDVPTIWCVVKQINKATYAEDEIYFYRQRIDSIVNTKYKHGRLDQVLFSEEIYKEVPDNSKLKTVAATRCFFATADNYALVSKDFPQDMKYLRNNVKKYRKYVLKDSSSGIALKIMAIASYVSIYFVRVMGRMYKEKNYRRWRKQINGVK